MRRSIRAVVLLALAAVPGLTAGAQSGYHVTGRINTGGDGGWDYLSVDTAGHRLYVSRGTHVQVVDVDRDSLVGDLQDTPGVHGIAFAPALGRGFTSNGRDTSVTIFDLKTLAPIKVVKVTGLNPDAILFDDATGRVFTFNHTGASATAIDAKSGAIVGTVALSGAMEEGQSDGHGTIYVNVENKNLVDVFDARTLTVKGHIELPGCDEPTGMGIDRTKMRLWIGCGNKTMAVVDYRAGKVVATVPAGAGIDGAGFDPGTGLAFASAGDGTLTVVREEPANHFVSEMVPTTRGARTMALDPRTHRVYLSSAQYGPMPAPTADRPRPRAPLVPGSFTVLVVGR